MKTKHKKKNKEDLITYIELPIFGYKLNIITIDSLTKLPDLLNKKENKRVSDAFFKCLPKGFKFSKFTRGMVIPNEDDYPEFFILTHKAQTDTILHELTHVIDMLAEFHRFETEKEFKAYLVSSIYNQIMDKVNPKIKFKIKKK